jgi:rod shape-determining protein MreD
MKYVLATLIAWFMAAVNVSALPYLKVLGVTPDFVLILAACWAVLRPQDEAMIVVPIAGLLHDLMYGDPLGTSVLAFAPLVILAAVVHIRAVETQFIPSLIVTAAGTLTYGAARMSVLAVTGQEVQWLNAALHLIIPLAVVNVLFMPLAYIPLSWFSAAQRQGMMGRGRITSPL